MATKLKPRRSEAEVHSELLEALKRVSDEKDIPVEALVASIEGALVSAYKKAYGGTGAVRVKADFESGEFRVYAQKLIVQNALNPNTEVAWREARGLDANSNLGDLIEVEVTPSGFGRIAAQTAKQVLLQKLREAERVQVASEFADRSDKIYRGQVLRTERGNVVVGIGKAEAILPQREQVQGENYRTGDSIYLYVVEVRSGYRGPSITVSRTHPNLVRQLFVLEVPEIADGIVELKAVAREAGQRTKIAVSANNPDVDPVGACVGPRGMRVGKVVGELGNEKVDIVRWSSDAIQYISNALSPAQISKVMLLEKEGEVGEGKEKGTATVIVAEDQQSLAIGKQGQNVRLAAKLTDWRIDIRTEKQYAEEQAKRMFAGDLLAMNSAVVRQSPDETAGIFSTDDSEESEGEESASSTRTSEENSVEENSTQSESELSDLLAAPVENAEIGSASPIGDVKLFPVETEADALPTAFDDTSSTRSEETVGEVSDVAPADSANA